MKRLLLGLMAVLAAAELAVADEVPASVIAALLCALCSGALLVAAHRPGTALPWGWRCLAANTGLTVIGHLLYARAQAAGEPPFPSVADAAYLASYVPLVAAVVGFGRVRRRRLPAVLDAAVVTVAVALPLWFLVGEAAVASGRVVERLIALAYPVMDVAVLAVLAVLLLARDGRGRAEVVLTVAVVGLVASDVGFLFTTADGSYVSGSRVDAGWLLQYLALTWLALSPEGRDLGTPTAGSTRTSRRRAAVLAVAVMSPSSVVLHDGPLHGVDVAVLCGAAVALGLLVLARLVVLADVLDGDLVERERDAKRAWSVAEADAILLQAVDRADLQASALQVVLAIVGDGRGRCAAALALGAPPLLEVVQTAGRDLPVEQVAFADLPALLATAAPLLARGEEHARAAGPDEDTVLVLPLLAKGRPVGALVVSAPADQVGRARAALRSSAPQIAFALDALRTRERADGSAGLHLPPGFVADVNRSMAARRFVSHYQPIVDLDDGRPVGFEALVRWDHPERGLLQPAAFLSQVEAAGLLSALDGLLLRTACADAMAWDPRPTGPYVSVNLSPSMLREPGTVSTVRAALLDSGLPPWRLLVEVTETAALEDPQAVADVLRRLREQKVRVALDDFGTGYSALSWLQQLPLDIVKVDRSFVDQLPLRPGGRPVVEAVVRLAQTLGLDVVAEGVEDEAQAAALRAMGVTRGQGWLFSRAVPFDHLRQMLPVVPDQRRNPDGSLQPHFSWPGTAVPR